MGSRSKIDDVQFYLDRSQDSLITLIRSIIENPRIPDLERLQALQMLADHHQYIADFISSKISSGEQQGVQKRVADDAKLQPC